MNVEKGFRRVVMVLSLTILLAGLGFVALLTSPHFTASALFQGVVAVILVASVPWVLFFVIRWIVRGFIEGSEEKPR